MKSDKIQKNDILRKEVNDIVVRTIKFPRKGTFYWRIWEEVQILVSEESFVTEEYIERLYAKIEKLTTRRQQYFYVMYASLIVLLFTFFDYASPVSLPFLPLDNIDSNKKSFELAAITMLVTCSLANKVGMKVNTLEIIIKSYAVKMHGKINMDMYLVQWGIGDLFSGMKNHIRRGYHYNNQDKWYFTIVTLLMGLTYMSVVLIAFVFVFISLFTVTINPQFGIISYAMLFGALSLFMSSILEAVRYSNAKHFYKKKNIKS